jgi:hypothetical protein
MNIFQFHIVAGARGAMVPCLKRFIDEARVNSGRGGHCHVVAHPQHQLTRHFIVSRDQKAGRTTLLEGTHICPATTSAQAAALGLQQR